MATNLLSLAIPPGEEMGASGGGAPEPEVWQIFMPSVATFAPNVTGNQMRAGPEAPMEPRNPLLGFGRRQRGNTDSSEELEIWFKDYCCCGLPIWYCPGDHQCDCPEEPVTTPRPFSAGFSRVRHDSSRSSGGLQVMSDHIREALGRWSQEVEHCCEQCCCCKGREYCCKFYCGCGMLRWSCDIHRFEGLEFLFSTDMRNCRRDSPPPTQRALRYSQAELLRQNDQLCIDSDQQCPESTRLSTESERLYRLDSALNDNRCLRRSPGNQRNPTCRHHESPQSPSLSLCSQNLSPLSQELSPPSHHVSPCSLESPHSNESTRIHDGSPGHHTEQSGDCRDPPRTYSKAPCKPSSPPSGHIEAASSAGIGEPRFGQGATILPWRAALLS